MKKLLTIITTLAMALGSYAGEPLELWYDNLPATGTKPCRSATDA